jgi:hypothetical protein
MILQHHRSAGATPQPLQRPLQRRALTWREPDQSGGVAPPSALPSLSGATGARRKLALRLPFCEFRRRQIIHFDEGDPYLLIIRQVPETGIQEV